MSKHKNSKAWRIQANDWRDPLYARTCECGTEFRAMDLLSLKLLLGQHVEVVHKKRE